MERLQERPTRGQLNSVAFDVSIVVVNWNSGFLLRACLRSIAVARLPHPWRLAAVVVIDNASVDGSCDGLDAGEFKVVLIRNAENRGFAKACNQGAKAVPSDLVLFLNPDTRLFGDSLRIPVEYMATSSNVDVGIAGIQLVDDSGEISRSCANFPRAWHFLAQALGVDRLLPSTSHQMRHWDHKQTRRVDQVIGAFFMVRRAVFEKLGGFDERFFVYFEEVDFALRARGAGWSSVYLADAQAYHAGGGTSRQVRGKRLFYSLRSRLQYGVKHYALPELLLLACVSVLLEPISRLLLLSLTGRFGEIRDLLQAYVLLARYGAALVVRHDLSPS